MNVWQEFWDLTPCNRIVHQAYYSKREKILKPRETLMELTQWLIHVYYLFNYRQTIFKDFNAQFFLQQVHGYTPVLVSIKFAVA